MSNSKRILVTILLLITLPVLLRPLIAQTERAGLQWLKPFLAASQRITHLIGGPPQSPFLCRLKERTVMLESQVVRMKELELENERLRGLLAVKAALPYRTVAARVIGRGVSNWSSTIVIDKGRYDKIKLNAPLLLEEGVVGKVLDVGTHTSKAVVLIDPGCKVPAMVQRSRVEGLLTGGLDRQCRLIYLPPDSDILLGDKIITSGMSDIFPKGLPIGEVVRLAHTPGSHYLSAEVRPYVDFDSIEEVLCIE